jgi:hypothetical protein
MDLMGGGFLMKALVDEESRILLKVGNFNTTHIALY